MYVCVCRCVCIVRMASKQDLPDEHTTLCSQAAWTDVQVSLHDVSSQFNLPTLAQVVTGRYRGIAPADSKHHHHHHHHHHASSRRASSSIVFIQSVRTSQKVLVVIWTRSINCVTTTRGPCKTCYFSFLS